MLRSALLSLAALASTVMASHEICAYREFDGGSKYRVVIQLHHNNAPYLMDQVG